MNEEKIQEIQLAINKAVDEIRGANNMRKIVDEVAVIVRRRTLLGFGVAKDGGARQRLKPLSQSYKDQRSGAVIFFRDAQGRVRKVAASSSFQSRLKLSSKTTVGKSNLTLTGELLDSLKGFVIGPGRGVVKPTGIRADGLSNQVVAGYVDEGGRPFLHLSNNEIKQMQIFAEEIFRKILIKK